MIMWGGVSSIEILLDILNRLGWIKKSRLQPPKTNIPGGDRRISEPSTVPLPFQNPAISKGKEKLSSSKHYPPWN